MTHVAEMMFCSVWVNRRRGSLVAFKLCSLIHGCLKLKMQRSNDTSFGRRAHKA